MLFFIFQFIFIQDDSSSQFRPKYVMNRVSYSNESDIPVCQKVCTMHWDESQHILLGKSGSRNSTTKVARHTSKYL